MKKKMFLLLLIFLFILIALNVYNGNNFKIDSFFYEVIYKYVINDKLTPYIKLITNMGSFLGISIFLFISFILFKNKKVNLSIVINLVLIILLNIVLKDIFMRERPSINMLIPESGYSFPSGHAMVSIAFYGYLLFLINTYFKNNKVKKIWMISISILILLIGLSRIYLGVHYLSDILGGYIFSSIYLILYTKMIKKYLPKKIF